MLSTSNEFKRKYAENTKVALKATLELLDGTTLELVGDDFTLGGLSVSSSSSSGSAFEVGGAVIGVCTLTLANYDQRFDDYDFTDAVVIPYVGMPLDAGGTEWLRLGTYNAEQPNSYDSTVNLLCYDNLRLLDKPYKGVATSYPATLSTIVREACAASGLVTVSDDFPNANYVVATRPSDESLTRLDVVAHAAQCAGCYVYTDQFGRVGLRWYETSIYEGEDWLDGGTFDTGTTPYSDGDSADGGAFMTGGDSYDGGAFASSRWAHLTAIRSLTVSTDDVVITGVQVTASNQVNEDGTIGEDGETALFGSAGYVLRIDDNPLVCYGQAATVAANIGAAVVGMRFRPFHASGIADPSWRAGDAILVTDARQRTYRSWLTTYTWRVGAMADLDCNAATPARNGAGAALGKTREMVEMRRSMRAERTARIAAMKTLEDEILNSSGFYETTETQPDGSTIWYAHNKPKLSESLLVWKMTADALAWSIDGGRTWPYGLDITGNAILNKIYIIGINAKYINTGRIAVGGTTANPLFVVDIDTGQVYMRSADGNTIIDLLNNTVHFSGSVTLGSSKTVTNMLSQLSGSATKSVTEYCLGTSDSQAPATGDSGWGPTMPTWVDGKFIWQRTKTTPTEGAATYTTPTLVNGVNGLGGYATEIEGKADGATDAAQAAQGAADTAQGMARTAQASADDAATKATRFVDIVPGVGIKMGDMLGELTQRMLQLTPDAIEFLNDGVSVSSFGDTTRIGAEGDYHVSTTPTEVGFYEGTRRRAYLSGDKFYAANIESDDAIFIGNYTIRTGSNGYLTVSRRS